MHLIAAHASLQVIRISCGSAVWCIPNSPSKSAAPSTVQSLMRHHCYLELDRMACPLQAPSGTPALSRSPR